MFRLSGDHLDGDMQQLLQSFFKELEIRERHTPIFNQHQERFGDRPRQQRQYQIDKVSTASALFIEKDN